MVVEIKDGKMVITMDMQAPRPSKSGKTLIVATSNGLIETTAQVDGRNITVGVNAFIRK